MSLKLNIIEAIPIILLSLLQVKAISSVFSLWNSGLMIHLSEMEFQIAFWEKKNKQTTNPSLYDNQINNFNLFYGDFYMRRMFDAMN